MPSSTRNVKLGVCRIYYDGADLGYTQGGVEVGVTTDVHPVNIDQFGKTEINSLIMGRNIKVKCPLAETTLRILVKTMPGSSLVTDGVTPSASVTFATNPTATTTFSIGGQAFTFSVAKPTTAYAILIGANLAASLANAVDVVNRAPIQVALGNVTAFASGVGVMTLTLGDPGTAGNAVTLSAALGGTASAATFAGGVNETRARVEVATGVGIELLSLARVLRLHPIGKADTDFTDDFVVYLAATAGALTFAYKVDAERIYNTEFMGYPDNLGRLFSVGDLLA